MGSGYFWHGSDRPRARFGNLDDPEVLHLGTLAQAAMRCGGKFLHLIETPQGGEKRIRDGGKGNQNTINRARKAGFHCLRYLNRYEGMATADLERALKRYPGKDFDAISDREFLRIFPEQRDSTLLLFPTRARVLGCYKGIEAAKAGYFEQITLKGAERRDRPAAAQVTFETWVGLRNAKIIEESKFGPVERSGIERCRSTLKLVYEALDYSAPDIIGLACKKVMSCDGVRYTSAPNALLAIDDDTQELLGGIARGVVYVEEGARRRGIASMLHICAEESRCIALKPTHFSTGGMAARRSAHRDLCERALSRGEHVLEENLQRYQLSDECGAKEIMTQEEIEP